MGFKSGAAHGLLVTGLVTAGMVLLRVVADVRTLPEVIADTLVPALPTSLFASATRALRPVAQPAGYALLFLLILALGALLGGLVGRWVATRAAGGEFSPARRAQLERAAWGALALAGAAGLWRYFQTPREGEAMASGALGTLRGPDGLAEEVTPNTAFYKVSKNVGDPKVIAADWRLQVIGAVRNPISLSLRDLQSLGQSSQWQTLECISNEVGGDYIGNAQWGGVPVASLISLAGGATAKAKNVVFHSVDNYADSFPLAKAMETSTLVALTMNGAPLPDGHGFPARLLVPGTYGMKNVKWLTTIDVVESEARGYWQQRGWSQTAIVKTTSRIDLPKRGTVKAADATRIAGIAFAGDRGIAKVEVSDDAGATWREARLKPPRGPYTWVFWEYAWNPTSGWHRLMVRATDSTGAVQSAEKGSTLPDGASGYHQVDVRVI